MIDKRMCNGKVYLKKGSVVDVHPGGLAEVSMDEDGRVLQVSLRSIDGQAEDLCVSESNGWHGR